MILQGIRVAVAFQECAPVAVGVAAAVVIDVVEVVVVVGAQAKVLVVAKEACMLSNVLTKADAYLWQMQMHNVRVLLMYMYSQMGDMWFEVVMGGNTFLSKTEGLSQRLIVLIVLMPKKR